MDREKVINAWECCNPFNRKCNECPYEKDCYHDGISRYMVADAIALLKEQEAEISRISNAYLELVGKASKQPKVVRCKDCKHRGDRHKCIVAFVAEKQEMPYFFYDNRGEWFCADGKRK